MDDFITSIFKLSVLHFFEANLSVYFPHKDKISGPFLSKLFTAVYFIK